MNILQNEPLSKYTAFNIGGAAEKLIIIDSATEISDLRRQGYLDGQFWVLGYGTNCVISDRGLDGTVIIMRDGPEPVLDEETLIIDAATNWDDAVKHAGDNGLWGIELMSGIPGNAGAALSGNIAAYGQAISDTFAWAEVFDRLTGEISVLKKGDIELAYRSSSLQTKQQNLVVLKLALRLSKQPIKKLEYSSALKVADNLGLKPDTLENCRQIIMETRKLAGSIYDESDPARERTAGSFFKNPIVDEEAAIKLAGYDESGKTIDELLEQNRIHGGDSFRVSAAHVLLAAGFSRGQTWGPVKLHDKHVLKIENAGDATGSQIYEVVEQIKKTVFEKLGIELETEVQFVGDFSKED